MKRILLSTLVLVGLPLYAREKKTEEQTITFKNENTESVKITVKNRKNGEKIKDIRLQTSQFEDFKLKPDVEYTVQAEEMGDKPLKTPIYNLSLRSRYTTGEVIASRTTPLFRNEAILILSGKNAVVRTPWWKLGWAKPEDKPVRESVKKARARTKK